MYWQEGSKDFILIKRCSPLTVFGFVKCVYSPSLWVLRCLWWMEDSFSSQSSPGKMPSVLHLPSMVEFGQEETMTRHVTFIRRHLPLNASGIWEFYSGGWTSYFNSCFWRNFPMWGRLHDLLRRVFMCTLKEWASLEGTCKLPHQKLLFWETLLGTNRSQVEQCQQPPSLHIWGVGVLKKDLFVGH